MYFEVVKTSVEKDNEDSEDEGDKSLRLFE
jgi:hypothetical protein